MPLKFLDTPHYIKRTKVFVSYRYNIEGSTDGLTPLTLFQDEAFALPEAIQNVVGIEVRNFVFDRRAVPTFKGARKSFLPEVDPPARSRVKRNLILDAEFGDPTGTNTTTLSIDFDNFFFGQSLANYRFRLPNTYVELVNIYLLFGFAGLGAVPGFDPADYTLSFLDSSLSDTQPYFARIQQDSPPNDYGTVRFLFGTGPNNEDSMHASLGFPNEDTTPDPTFNGVLAPYISNRSPFRYVDINVAEIPELKPVARFHFTKEGYVSPTNTLPRTTRLLDQPLQRMDQITTQLRLSENRPLSSLANRSFEIEYEILSLEPSINIPAWVNQEMKL